MPKKNNTRPASEHVGSASDGNDRIGALLRAGTTFVAGRLGTNEICLLWWNASTDAIPGCSNTWHSASGIYPETLTMLKRFTHVYTRSVQSLGPDDVLGAFRHRPLEYPIMQRLAPRTPIYENGMLGPWFHSEPWSQHLAGKTVAVVHPFNASIACQLRRRNELFTDARVLPATATIKLVPMYVALFGLTPHGSWLETLDAMKHRVREAGHFDVAIIGAGSYGMPLASFVRTELGRSAVVMGGYSQVLFGLKGERWAEEDAKKMNTLFSNPAWMFPLMDDTPERLRGGGAGSQYWARRPGDAHQSCPV